MSEIDWERRLHESIEAFNRGDYEGTLKHAAEDVEYYRGERAPESRESLRGRDAVIAFLAPDVLTEAHAEILDFRAGSSAYLVELLFRAKGAASDIEVSLPAWMVFVIGDSGEEIVRIEVHNEQAGGLAAAGLDP